MAPKKGQNKKSEQPGASCSNTSDTNEENENRECAVCLQPCIQPVKLPCSHVFCFLCVKGTSQSNKRCAMCRQEIPANYLDKPNLLSNELPKLVFEGSYQWFYEGKNGWWQYDERTSAEIETAYQNKEKKCDVLIAGFMYTIDLENYIQVRQNDSSRRRKIKRDLVSISKKGVAGVRLTAQQAGLKGAATGKTTASAQSQCNLPSTNSNDKPCDEDSSSAMNKHVSTTKVQIVVDTPGEPNSSNSPCLRIDVHCSAPASNDIHVSNTAPRGCNVSLHSRSAQSTNEKRTEGKNLTGTIVTTNVPQCSKNQSNPSVGKAVSSSHGSGLFAPAAQEIAAQNSIGTSLNFNTVSSQNSKLLSSEPMLPPKSNNSEKTKGPGDAVTQFQQSVQRRPLNLPSTVQNNYVQQQPSSIVPFANSISKPSGPSTIAQNQNNSYRIGASMTKVNIPSSTVQNTTIPSFRNSILNPQEQNSSNSFPIAGNSNPASTFQKDSVQQKRNILKGILIPPKPNTTSQNPSNNFPTGTSVPRFNNLASTVQNASVQQKKFTSPFGNNISKPQEQNITASSNSFRVGAVLPRSNCVFFTSVNSNPLAMVAVKQTQQQIPTGQNDNQHYLPSALFIPCHSGMPRQVLATSSNVIFVPTGSGCNSSSLEETKKRTPSEPINIDPKRHCNTKEDLGRMKTELQKVILQQEKLKLWKLQKECEEKGYGLPPQE